MATPKAASTRKGRTRISAKAAANEEKLNRHWRGKFLAALAENSNVAASARAVGVDPSRPYKVRREEPDFARQWQDALCEGYDNLELEVLQRLRFGEDKTEQDRRFDNGAAIRQLALYRETVSRLRALRDEEDAEAVREAIDAKLAQLRARVAARRAAEGKPEQPHDDE